MDLGERLEALGRKLVQREAEHAAAFAAATDEAARIHSRVVRAVERFNAATRERLPQLEIEVSAPRVDDKHLRAVQFELRRGRHRAVVTVKSRGEVTLVGPFRSGKNEGPCRTHPIGAEAAIDAALGQLLEDFVEQAARP